ncbi:MAG TPA: DUF1543 domain-containing protein [Alphaproteobacteria bacterium]|nr:DUF1543 domain-containing protein [Alphaproteobacteria bacterium]
MNLFVIYIGGSHKQSLIELHDVRFVIADSIEETYEDLRRSWWGTPESLHLDCWGVLKSADGYNICLKYEPSKNENKLYFLNLGGYDSKQFTELHKNVFVVAPNKREAKVKALKEIQDWKAYHKDTLFEVENIFCLNDFLAKKGLYIHLQPTDTPSPFEFTCKYIKIGGTKQL